MSESQGGGADGPEPTGEEGAGGHRAGAAGTTVRMHKLIVIDLPDQNAPALTLSSRPHHSRSGLDYVYLFVPSLTQIFSAFSCHKKSGSFIKTE